MSEHRSLRGRIVDRTTTGSRGFSRHDIVLLAIPAAYLLVTIGGSLFGALRLGLTAASVVAGLVVLDALFLHLPLRRGGRDGDSTTASAAALAAASAVEPVATQVDGI